MMTKNQKICRIAALHYEITKIDYEDALIRAQLKQGDRNSLRAKKEKITSEMYKLADEVKMMD